MTHDLTSNLSVSSISNYFFTCIFDDVVKGTLSLNLKVGNS